MNPPVNQELHIQYYTESDKPEVFMLCNAVEQVVGLQLLAEKSGNVTLFTANLPNGIYYYFLGNNSSGKVIILH